MLSIISGTKIIKVYIKVEKVITSFNSELCYGQGTLLSGVFFHYNNLQVFTIMDIHVLKGG